MGLFWRQIEGGLMVAIKVQPNARRAGVFGCVPDVAGQRLKLGVAAPPEDGRANAAVCTLLADFFGVSGRDVEVVQGFASRLKSVRVNGDPAGLFGRLAAL